MNSLRVDRFRIYFDQVSRGKYSRVGLLCVELMWLGAGLVEMRQGALGSVGACRKCWFDLERSPCQDFYSRNSATLSTGIRVYQVRISLSAEEKVSIPSRSGKSGYINIWHG